MSERRLTLPGGRPAWLAEPAVRKPGAPLVVLLNAGAIHRAGPFGLSRTLSSAANAAGLAALRFDQGGIGDQLQAEGEEDVAALGAILDAAQAETGATRFVMGGLCSAADQAWRIARTDPRIEGLLLLDPLARGAPWLAWGRVRLLAGRGPAGWWRALSRRSARLGRPAVAVSAFRDWPAPGDERRDFERFLDRGVEILAVYTGGAGGYFLHPGQWQATFGPRIDSPQASFVHWPACDHLFFRPSDRERLGALVTAWLLGGAAGRDR